MLGITVYCSSSDSIDSTYFDAARKLGAEIARHGLPVINGGGKMGLMAAVSYGALQAGGEAIGVIPQFMYDMDRHHKSLTDLIITSDMRTRKGKMAELAMGCIAMPGGIGTIEEVSEMMTERKLGLFKGAVVLLNTNGYYDHMLAWLRTAKEQGFSYGDEVEYLVASTPEEAVKLIIENANS